MTFSYLYSNFKYTLFLFSASIFRGLPADQDAFEVYARPWAKKENVELDTFTEWIKLIGDVIKRRILKRLKHSVNTRFESIFRDPDVVQ